VSKCWEIDEIRPAAIYANIPQIPGMPALELPHEKDDKGRVKFPAYLLTAHKPGYMLGPELLQKAVRDHQVRRTQIVHGGMAETKQRGVDTRAHYVEDVFHTCLTTGGQSP
jgi:hypothetical protein